MRVCRVLASQSILLRGSFSVRLLDGGTLEIRRYYICDDKLAALGWKETIPWEEGLKKTIEWYLEQNIEEYWDAADVERALQPHPVIQGQGARFKV